MKLRYRLLLVSALALFGIVSMMAKPVAADLFDIGPGPDAVHIVSGGRCLLVQACDAVAAANSAVDDVAIHSLLPPPLLLALFLTTVTLRAPVVRLLPVSPPPRFFA